MTAFPSNYQHYSNRSIYRDRRHWHLASQARIPSAQDISARTHPDVLQIFRQKIHGEVDAMKHAIALMQSQLNSVAPISLLPVELLAECFTILADAHPPSGRQDLGWITVTHVCHHWRDFALSMSSLWAAPAFSLGSRWVSEMVIRSKGRPLTIWHSLAFKGAAPQSNRSAIADAKNVIDILREHLDRVKHIELNGFLPSSIDTALSTLCRPAPFLRALNISHTGFGHPISIPSNFLAGNAPLFRSLELPYVEGDWMVPAIRNLHCLVVYGSKASRSMDPFLDLLERNPELRSLEINSVFFPVIHPPSGTRSLELPNLQYFTFHGSASSCSILLNSFLKNPVALAVTLLVERAETPEDDHDTLYAAVSAKVALRHLPFRVLSIGHGVKNNSLPGTILFETSRRIRWTNDRPDFAPFAVRPPSFALRLHPPMSPFNDRIACIINAIQKLSFNDIEMLIVRKAGGYPGVWEVLSRLPSIKYLEFSHRPLEVIRLLSHKSNQTESGLSTVSAFPQLTHLRIQDIDFTWYPGGLTPELQDHLVSMLCTRTQTICRVQWLCLTDCTISEETLEKIRKIVPEVFVEDEDD
ncbi:uncharacterized protein STEHIDRAFT_112648 [Stereum hirsutum FP-91666 SS1]|uniref:uncharacterized protein n=1 Tax=Stereum hirsutum (strain FP-91666) TaxID=721885 RepID=UPI00044493A5|nr:uncharacterized protein STEHIDRAFT_112648 [Stereum hirsutum FP-91666 SS1]EIM84207.1 hypothetical protein STEHIDRAFT_112648 [Stereum hirsutum FP-91666 SS1]